MTRFESPERETCLGFKELNIKLKYIYICICLNLVEIAAWTSAFLPLFLLHLSLVNTLIDAVTNDQASCSLTMLKVAPGWLSPEKILKLRSVSILDLRLHASFKF